MRFAIFRRGPAATEDRIIAEARRRRVFGAHPPRPYTFTERSLAECVFIQARHVAGVCLHVFVLGGEGLMPLRPVGVCERRIY